MEGTDEMKDRRTARIVEITDFYGILNTETDVLGIFPVLM